MQKNFKAYEQRGAKGGKAEQQGGKKPGYQPCCDYYRNY